MGWRLLAAVALGLAGCAAPARGPAPRVAAVLAEAGLPAATSNGAPARAYGALEANTCARELWRRGVPFAYVDGARGVNAPIRLTGPIRGVDFHGEPKSKRATSAFEILDCRLALALDDLARILAAHGVIEATHMSMYRPPGGVDANYPRRKHPSQHGHGLAIDVGSFVLRDGTRLVIERDWHGAIGDRSCGADASSPRSWTPEAAVLRSILCATVEARLFNVVLTPNHDAAHFNHFHLDVTQGVSWFIVK